MSVLRAEDVQRLGLDVEACLKNGEALRAAHDLVEKLSIVFNKPYENATTPVNVDLALYSGGFFSTVDKKAMTQIRSTEPEKLATFSFHYDDVRLPEMLFRYRARNYPNTLTGEEWHKWHEFCLSQLMKPENGASLTLNDYVQRVKALQKQGADTSITKALLDYARDKIQQLDINDISI